MSPGLRREAGGQCGAVLLAVLLLMTMAAAASVSMIERAASAAAELRARRDVLCARYAALGGIALGQPAGEAAGLVGPRVDALAVSRVRLGPTWCVLRAWASCDSATRTLDHTLADQSACSSP